jgi:hypothetical protein
MEYVRNGGNATRAYLHAYECTQETAAANCSRMMENDGVAERIKEIRSTITANELINLSDLIATEKEILDRCMTQVPVREMNGVTKQYENVVQNGETVMKFDAAGAHKAIELMGKMIAAYTDNVNNNLSGNITVKPFTITNGEGSIEEATD